MQQNPPDYNYDETYSICLNSPYNKENLLDRYLKDDIEEAMNSAVIPSYNQSELPKKSEYLCRTVTDRSDFIQQKIEDQKTQWEQEEASVCQVSNLNKKVENQLKDNAQRFKQDRQINDDANSATEQVEKAKEITQQAINAKKMQEQLITALNEAYSMQNTTSCTNTDLIKNHNVDSKSFSKMKNQVFNQINNNNATLEATLNDQTDKLNEMHTLLEQQQTQLSVLQLKQQFSDVSYQKRIADLTGRVNQTNPENDNEEKQENKIQMPDDPEIERAKKLFNGTKEMWEKVIEDYENKLKTLQTVNNQYEKIKGDFQNVLKQMEEYLKLKSVRM